MTISRPVNDRIGPSLRIPCRSKSNASTPANPTAQAAIAAAAREACRRAATWSARPAGRRRSKSSARRWRPTEVVERICSDVRTQGLDAVLRYTAKLDGAQLSANTLRVPADDLASAHAHAAPDVSGNDPPHPRQHPAIPNGDPAPRRAESRSTRTAAGCGSATCRSERVGICVPGGAAAYPSTVLMTAVPAQAAGVSQIVVVSPPTPNGAYNPDVLATCHELGIREVYRMGGAQAIAALAYGLDGLVNGPLVKVDKIVGPGNQFVALAKKYVYGDVDIDSIAGPSEVSCWPTKRRGPISSPPT